jgi:hypothetical protein
MVLDLDTETRLALVDEIKRRVPPREQRQLAYAIAEALGTEDTTEVARLSRFLNKHAETIDVLLGPDRAEKVLDAICQQLGGKRADLVRAARRAAQARPRPTLDRHPAWQELGEATPWVDRVPGLPDGMTTLRQTVESLLPGSVAWLVGPAGSGKSARLWRAEQQGIGKLVDRVPHEAAVGTVWLVDEPQHPDGWIAWAAQCRTRLIIATPNARSANDTKIELTPWFRREVESFLDELGRARGPGRNALGSVDLELIADTLAALGSSWTPLDLGNVIRLFVDEPALLERDANDHELRIRSALHQLIGRAVLLPHQKQLWSSHGRQALGIAAAASIRGSSTERVIGPVAESALRDVLADLAGPMVGGPTGEPLRVILERARNEGGNKALKLIETWAQALSSDDLIELLVDVGAWHRTSDTMLAPVDETLAIVLAAERLDDDWMWRRLLETLADPGWSPVRMAWAPQLGSVLDRMDHLLATGAAIHVGAIELATALVAFARESPREEQATRVVFSAVQLLICDPLTQAGLGPRREFLLEALWVASRRHRRTLPQVTAALTPHDLVERGTPTTHRVVHALESLAATGAVWIHGGTAVSPALAWIIYAMLLPWQAVSALQAPDSRSHLLTLRPSLLTLRLRNVDWGVVIMDHAADGHPWARSVATGDVDDAQVTADLISPGGLLRALCRWPGPSDPQRHQQALSMVLQGLPYGSDAPRPRRHAQAVQAVVGFVRRHPGHLLPDAMWLRYHEDVWREALDQAAATDHLQAWFDQAHRALAGALYPDDTTTPFGIPVAPNRQPPLDVRGMERLLRLGEVLHRHGIRAPLYALLAEAKTQPYAGRSSLAWELGLGATAALLRLRDAEELRSVLGRSDSAQAAAVEIVLAREHDEETRLWIVDVLGQVHQDFLASIAGRPERRDMAKRWALDPSHSYRRHVAAKWLIEHPASEEAEYVQWLLTSEPVAHSCFYVRAGLAHPDVVIRRAAAGLLQRVLREASSNTDLVSVAHCFGMALSGHNVAISMSTLRRWVEQVNDSDQMCSAESLQTMISLAQRHLATVSDDESSWYARSLCSSLATAARRLRLASLASWVRAPLGELTDAPAAPSRIESVELVREAIASGIFARASSADIERSVLQALADTAGMLSAIHAYSFLLELDIPSDAQLMAEWAMASDAVLIEKDQPTARWIAVQTLLRQRDPCGFARALADRLLSLPVDLRRLGILQISQVAMHDPEQAARLSTLFDGSQDDI